MLDVARRLDAVVDLNPGFDLLGVVLFSTGTGAHRIKDEARARIVEALGAEDVVLRTAIRHSEAIAHAARERGAARARARGRGAQAPVVVSIRRGEAEAGGAPRTASRVTDDYQSLAAEIVDRITAAEQALAQEVSA